MKSNDLQGRNSGMSVRLITTLAAVVMFVGAAAQARAQTPTVLYAFHNVPTDACQPEGNIVQGRDGNMYGLGLYCGANNTGSMYKISSTGSESLIYSFPSNWSFCFSGLTLGNDGNFTELASPLRAATAQFSN